MSPPDVTDDGSPRPSLEVARKARAWAARGAARRGGGGGGGDARDDAGPARLPGLGSELSAAVCGLPALAARAGQRGLPSPPSELPV